MPFSDLFKKSPKKEPDKKDPFGTPEMQKKRHDAAMEFVKIFQEKIPLLAWKASCRDSPCCCSPIGRIEPVSLAEFPKGCCSRRCRAFQ